MSWSLLNRLTVGMGLSGVLIAIIVGTLILPGCTGKNKEEKGPTILCTTTIVADVVRQVAGPHQSIGVLMGAGVDPHLFNPSPRDARQLSQAQLIFYSGLNLEGKMSEL